MVHVASATHRSVRLDPDDIGLEHGYSPVRAYAQSKLGMVAHARWQAGNGALTARGSSASARE
ncbi:hypothetical protein ACIBBD_18180 [Streptomyces sp. NPDC051315]|uniref:hypothetical protein n=1 Tax=Streptomyces sp. NPDC051315 TaxID=3365650 RepID=UPI00379F6437